MSIVTITKENFSAEVLAAEQPVLLDFWAPWCGPCRMVGPMLEQIAKERQGSLKVAKINIDEQPDLAAEFAVMSIPTLLVFENGKVKKSGVGAMPKSSLLALVEA